MSLLKILFAGMAAVILAGCAHPITVTPNIAKLEQSAGSNRVPVSVGYYIPPELETLEVTTPGGGGDNVRYYPYRDIEPGFAKLLANVFSGVVKLTSAPVFSDTNPQRLDYIVQPQLVTSSGSTGFFTWPPTNFGVDLTSDFRDTAGKLVASPRVLGVGTAETGERLSDHGIAGRRAMEDALVKMQAAIQDQKFVTQTVATPVKQLTPKPGSSSSTARLAHLKDLLASGLISQAEYDAKRKEILDAL